MNRNILKQFSTLRQIRLHQRRVLISCQCHHLLQVQKTQSRNLIANFSRKTIFATSRCDLQQADQTPRDTMAAPEYTVDHDTKNNYFFILLGEPDLKAKLEYDWVSPTFVDMHHTETPQQFQGKGIAKHLAKAAFDHFSSKHITMRPSCTYLQKYLRDNPLPKYTEFVEKDFMKIH